MSKRKTSAARAGRTSPKRPEPGGRAQAGRLRQQLSYVRERLRDVQLRLEEAEGALFEIRTGAVDALLVQTEEGEKVFTLRGAEHPYRLFVENMSEGAATLSREGTILFANGRLAEMLGVPLERLMGSTIWERLTEEGREAVRGMFPAGTGARTDGEIELVRDDGSRIPFEVSIANLQLAPHGLIHCMVLRDISARRRADEAIARKTEELARSNRELEQFAYVASHDLREPLRMISSYLELFRRRYQGTLDERADQYIGYILEGAHRMNALISDLLDYSRVGSDRFPAQRVDVEAVLGAVLRNLDRAILESHGAVTHDPLPSAYLHPTLMGVLLQNLIENGLKFRREEPPRVHVSGRVEGDEAVFTVRDNGIGIDPRHLDRIFSLFQRLHARSEYPGTGIGLAVCKKIVDGAGGRIWAESRPGEGTTFSFRLPTGPKTLA